MASLKTVSLNLPNSYLNNIDTLVNIGVYHSRSEAIRDIIKKFLIQEHDLMINLEETEFKKLAQIKQREIHHENYHF